MGLLFCNPPPLHPPTSFAVPEVVLPYYTHHQRTSSAVRFLILFDLELGIGSNRLGLYRVFFCYFLLE